MEKTITLQKEFEELISELERLKSINEITSKNSNNAKATIDEIKGLFKAIDKFKNIIEKDYAAKKEEFETAKISLNEAIESLSNTNNKASKTNEKLQETFTNKTIETSEKFIKNLGDEIDRFKNETEIVKKTIKAHVTAFTKTTTDHLSEETLKLQEALIDSNEKQHSNFQILQNNFKDYSSALKTGLTEIKTSFGQKTSDLNEQIVSSNDALSKDIKLLLEKTERQNMKVNQVNKIIISFLVIMILLLGVLVFKNISPFFR